MKKGRGRPRKLSDLEEYLVWASYKKGVPVAEIAYKNNVSVSTVQRIVRRFKVLEKAFEENRRK